MKRLDFSAYKLVRPKKSAVWEVVDAYLRHRGLKSVIRQSRTLRAKYPFGRMLGRAKRLLESCGGKLEDALYMVEVKNWWL